MLDIDAEPLSPVDGGAYRNGGGALVDRRRPFLIAGAFAVAIVLGVAIGLVTVPDRTVEPTPQPTGTVAPEVMPPLAPVEWESNRRPGTAHQMRVRDQDRLALRASLAYALRGSAPNVSTADVVIPQGKLFYGAVEGSDRSTDVYWAVGLANVTGVSPAPPNPQVWKRTGEGAWSPVDNGPGACEKLPAVLYTVWQGRPLLCAGA